MTPNRPTQAEFASIAASTLGNMNRFVKLAQMKSRLQTEILPYLTNEDRNDIRNCIYNQTTVDKLIRLAVPIYRQSPDAETLYCLSMAIGTIVKEYDWGSRFISNEGCYQMGMMIYDAC